LSVLSSFLTHLNIALLLNRNFNIEVCQINVLFNNIFTKFLIYILQ
jgi:hypothetical protein